MIGSARHARASLNDPMEGGVDGAGGAVGGDDAAEQGVSSPGIVRTSRAGGDTRALRGAVERGGGVGE
ncbi:MAG: hypothetical protein H6703_11425 [Myxococcales bacterium]|nr:hypothetical protein [Myxococcales bacterium]